MSSNILNTTNSTMEIIKSEDNRYVQIGPSYFKSSTPLHYCIHHGPCPDGLTASWAIEYKLGKGKINMVMQSPGCIQLFNSVSIEDLRDTGVVFVDICPRKDILLQLLNVCQYILILDHHETNKKLINELIEDNIHNTYHNLNVVFDMNRAGCHITWDYFNYNIYDNKPKPRPWFLDYIGDSDLWYPSEHCDPNPLPNSRMVIKGLHEYGYLDNREKLQELYNCSGNYLNMAHADKRVDIINHQLIPMGELTISRNNKLIANIIKNAWLAEYTDEHNTKYYIWLVNNSNNTINSDLGNQLLDKPIIYQTDTIMPAFSVIIKGYDPIHNSLWLSLRGGKPYSPNVASICSRFGGGGHPAAAGVTIHINDFHMAFKVLIKS